MKALILAGGRGKRLGKVCQDQNKCMIEIEGKPLIGYSLDCAVLTNVSEIIIVVGYRAEEIINTFGNSYKKKLIKYITQPNQKGLVHAIEFVKRYSTSTQVIDPFVGRGSTLEVAKKKGLSGIGIDIDPQQCTKTRKALNQNVG